MKNGLRNNTVKDFMVNQANMVKLVLIHEGYNKGLSNKKRKILLNKHYIGYQK